MRLLSFPLSLFLSLCHYRSLSIYPLLSLSFYTSHLNNVGQIHIFNPTPTYLCYNCGNSLQHPTQLLYLTSVSPYISLISYLLLLSSITLFYYIYVQYRSTITPFYNSLSIAISFSCINNNYFYHTSPV